MIHSYAKHLIGGDVKKKTKKKNNINTEAVNLTQQLMN